MSLLTSQYLRMTSKLRVVFSSNVPYMTWAVSIVIYLIRDHMEADLPCISKLDHQIWTMTLPSLEPTVWLEVCFWICCCLFEFDARSCDADQTRLPRRSPWYCFYPVFLFCTMSEGHPQDFLFPVGCFSRWKRPPSWQCRLTPILRCRTNNSRQEYDLTILKSICLFLYK